MTNQDRIKLVVLLLAGVGAVVAAAPSFGYFATPAGLGTLMLSLGSVLGAAFGINTGK